MKKFQWTISKNYFLWSIKPTPKSGESGFKLIPKKLGIPRKKIGWNCWGIDWNRNRVDQPNWASSGTHPIEPSFLGPDFQGKLARFGMDGAANWGRKGRDSLAEKTQEKLLDPAEQRQKHVQVSSLFRLAIWGFGMQPSQIVDQRKKSKEKRVQQTFARRTQIFRVREAQ